MIRQPDMSVLWAPARMAAAAVLLWFGIAMTGGAAAQATLETGAQAYAAGDYAAALAAWQPLAEAGDANALFNIGQLYRLGRGVPADVAQAEAYYRRAAEKGHVGAQANLGTIYYFAKPGAPHVAEAIKWWEQAALGGDQRARYLLGVTYFNGKDVPQDAPRAYGWIRLAAEAGYEQAVAAEKVMIRALSVDELAAGHAFAKAVQNQTRAVAIAAPDAQTAKAPAQQEAAYMVQVGAFRDAAAAGSLAEKLMKAHKSVLAPGTAEIAAITSSAGQVMHRLRFGPYASRSAASTACKKLKGGGQSCFVTNR